MKLIIAGSRHLDEELAYGGIVSLRAENHEISNATEIVSGTCRGADKAGENYAEFYDIPIKKFPADWKKYGKSAGPIRNRQMGEYADALLLIWDGRSRGSESMKQSMLTFKKPVYEIIMRSYKITRRIMEILDILKSKILSITVYTYKKTEEKG